ncbi:hypothetical protein [Anianabacter salinae]|uniref:hypothetical protein n=1 Tax=Anianabacter salinae TaxID=2851023 RepID=UPI00225E4FEE|nr:hypothetical protein [Anianabacter salinae]MBV0911586.1 hypothetical protein [Anianabacter salinae]
MTLDEIDRTGLIRESYLIEGIGEPECRSIFLDWAVKLPQEFDPTEAIRVLLARYQDGNEDHPMTRVLSQGLRKATAPARRGGRAGRVGS